MRNIALLIPCPAYRNGSVILDPTNPSECLHSLLLDNPSPPLRRQNSQISSPSHHVCLCGWAFPLFHLGPIHDSPLPTALMSPNPPKCPQIRYLRAGAARPLAYTVCSRFRRAFLYFAREKILTASRISRLLLFWKPFGGRQGRREQLSAAS